MQKGVFIYGDIFNSIDTAGCYSTDTGNRIVSSARCGRCNIRNSTVCVWRLNRWCCTDDLVTKKNFQKAAVTQRGGSTTNVVSHPFYILKGGILTMKINYLKMLKGLKKAAPAILTGLSVVGVVLTSVMTAKCTIKALEQTEKKDDAWKCYIPAALTAIATSVCIIGTGILNRKQKASLLAAYGLLSSQYKDYIEKNKKISGEDTHKQIMSELAVEKVDENAKIQVPGLYKGTVSGWNTDDDETKHLFCDAFAKRYFETTISRVCQAEMAVMYAMTSGKFVSINDFYQYIGLTPIEGGDEIGWCVNDGYQIMEFDHYTAKVEDGSEDGLEILVIDYVYIPETESEIDSWL